MRLNEELESSMGELWYKLTWFENDEDYDEYVSTEEEMLDLYARLKAEGLTVQIHLIERLGGYMYQDGPHDEYMCYEDEIEQEEVMIRDEQIMKEICSVKYENISLTEIDVINEMGYDVICSGDGRKVKIFSGIRYLDKEKKEIDNYGKKRM